MKLKVLLPTDFSDNSWSAIVYALRLYKNIPCTFYLLHSYELKIAPMSSLSSTLLEHIKEGAVKEINEFRKQMVDANINPDFKKLGESYNIMSIECSNKNNLNETVKNFLEYDESIIGVFNIEPEMCYPLVAPGKSLDDMILNENDIIKLNKNTNAPN